MIKTYSITNARKNLSVILSQAEKDGAVFIRNRSGKFFILYPIAADRSPLDIPGLDTGITRQEILESIREGREQELGERRSTYESQFEAEFGDYTEVRHSLFDKLSLDEIVKEIEDWRNRPNETHCQDLP